MSMTRRLAVSAIVPYAIAAGEVDPPARGHR